MSNFTPGKWEADEEGEYEFMQTPFNKEMIAQMRGWSYLTGKGRGELHLSSEEAIEVQKANARLIAAAPDMYELLKRSAGDLGFACLLRLSNEYKDLFARIDGEETEHE